MHLKYIYDGVRRVSGRTDPHIPLKKSCEFRAQNTSTEFATRGSESSTRWSGSSFQWDVGISVGFSTETTVSGVPRHMQTRLSSFTQSYILSSIYLYRVVCTNFGHPALTSSFTKYKFLQAKNCFCENCEWIIFVACLQHLQKQFCDNCKVIIFVACLQHLQKQFCDNCEIIIYFSMPTAPTSAKT